MLAARANVASTSALNAPVSSVACASSSRRGVLVVTAASKKKDVRLQVTLECTEQKESGVQGMSRYMTMKVRTNATRCDESWTRARATVDAREETIGRDGWMTQTDGREGFDTDGTDVFAQNRRNTSQRLELMKYNPYMKKHTLHRELKK